MEERVRESERGRESGCKDNRLLRVFGSGIDPYFKVGIILDHNVCYNFIAWERFLGPLLLRL